MVHKSCYKFYNQKAILIELMEKALAKKLSSLTPCILQHYSTCLIFSYVGNTSYNLPSCTLEIKENYNTHIWYLLHTKLLFLIGYYRASGQFIGCPHAQSSALRGEQCYDMRHQQGKFLVKPKLYHALFLAL